MPLLAAANKSSTGNQLCNPPMVHSLAVLAAVQGSHAEAVALARGDGCVAVHKLTSKVSFFINPLESLSRSTRSHCLECNQWFCTSFSCMRMLKLPGYTVWEQTQPVCAAGWKFCCFKE